MSIDLDRRTVVTAGIATGLVGVFSTTAHAAAAARLVPLPKLEKPVTVAIMMDEGATMIDFAGPWEAFQDACVAKVPGFQLYTVAARPRSRCTPLATTGAARGPGCA